MEHTALSQVAALAARLGEPERDLAILAEGNTSARADEETFWVKASGFSMCGIGEDGFVRVQFQPVLAALAGEGMDDTGVRETLSQSRVDEESPRMPSVETFMHAYLLSLPDVAFVGHTHPTPLISLLGVRGCETIARQRLFPDEIVCCGPATAFVPYVDPGLPLAHAIQRSVEAYVAEFGTVPKTIWLQNHGLIALGKNPREVESATFMAVKAARAWLGALATGKPLNPLTPEQIDRIHTRPDEHYRQRLLSQLRPTVQ